MCNMNVPTRVRPEASEPACRNEDSSSHRDDDVVPSNFVDLFAQTAYTDAHLLSSRLNWVEGAIIVGAGPAGLATAACLKKRGVPSVILEKADCIGSLWRYRAYDRLRLHIDKKFCELPHVRFPESYPRFPSKAQFLQYLDSYAEHFDLRPLFGESVVEARYCAGTGMWQVESEGPRGGRRTFVGRWLVAATGENAQPVWPTDMPGLCDRFGGRVCHTSQYTCGEELRGKKALVVGCGNSGLEVALDLASHGAASTSLSTRSPVHVLPREILGFSTFSIAMTLLKFFSLQWTDRLLLLISRLLLGETGQYGLRRPDIGPMEMKCKSGKTPSLDAGTLAHIRAGSIQVVTAVREFTSSGCVFSDGSYRDLDVVVLATGFKSNIPSWLKENDLFSTEGFLKPGLACNWKGKNGLYSAGFARKGLVGVSMDAQNIAGDISQLYKHQPKLTMQL